MFTLGRRIRKPAALFAGALATAMLAGTFAFGSEDETPDPGDHGRVRAIEGPVSVINGRDERTSELSINSPLFSGDLVKSDRDARAEVQLADGSLVRLDGDTEVEFRSMIDPYGQQDEAAILRLTGGSLYLDVRDRRGGSGPLMQVDTPAASLYMQSSGLFRVDVERGRTRVTAASLRGTVEVAGDGGSVYLRSGQRTTVDPGEAPDHPVSFNSFSMDAFDRWNEERVTVYARAAARDEAARDNVDYEQIPDEVQPYAPELSRSGRWAYVPEYGTVWYPVGVAAGWRPYYYGHWAWGPYGSYWVGAEPWGWAPYHYGRWCHTASFGWVWAPGAVFSGAWVSWYYGPTSVGWCPLNYWNQPAFIHIGFHFGGWGYDPHCWNYVPWHSVYVKNVNKVVIKNPPADMGRGILVRRAVPLRPDLARKDAVGRGQVIDAARRVHDRELAHDRDGAVPVKGTGKPSRPDATVARDSRGEGGRTFRDDERPDLGRLRQGAVSRTKAPDRDGGGQAAHPAKPGRVVERSPGQRAPAPEGRVETRPSKGQPATSKGREQASGGDASGGSITRMLRDADKPGKVEGDRAPAGGTRPPQASPERPRAPQVSQPRAPQAPQSRPPQAAPRPAAPPRSGGKPPAANSGGGGKPSGHSSGGGSRQGGAQAEARPRDSGGSHDSGGHGHSGGESKDNSSESKGSGKKD